MLPLIIFYCKYIIENISDHTFREKMTYPIDNYENTLNLSREHPLKTINSPLYGMRREISSIQQAVTLLGFRTIANLVTGISLRLASGDAGKLHLDRFWDSASDVALLASNLSRQLMVSDAEET